MTGRDVGTVQCDVESDAITVRNARTHNLQGLTVSFPRNKIVAFTGVSGSGKSSLAIDTIHAEAQLRYLEGLSPFVRQYITPQDRPKLDGIDGLGPTLAVDQRKLNRNPNSTLSTISGLDAYLRLMFSRLPMFLGTGGAAVESVTSAMFDRSNLDGACSECQGSGERLAADVNTLVADSSLSLAAGAVPWFSKLYSPEQALLQTLADCYQVDLSVTWRDLPEQMRHDLLFGTDGRIVEADIIVPNRNSKGEWKFHFAEPMRGAISEVHRLYTAAKTAKAKERYLPFLHRERCTVCSGSGFGAAARELKLAGRSFASIVGDEVGVLTRWLTLVLETLADAQLGEFTVLVNEASSRVDLMNRLGLAHLNLDRSAPTMSGGELQRARLVSQLGSPLVGITYVLDEPSSGLHPADCVALAQLLKSLRDAGSSVLIVEHEPLIIAAADWVVDLGPGAGSAGGSLLWSGPSSGFAKATESRTAAYVLDQSIPLTRSPLADANVTTIGFSVRRVRNIIDQHFDLRLGALNCIVGLSGSGKSTALHDAVFPALHARLMGTVDEAVSVDERCRVGWVELVTQDPIGKSSRSTPGTYAKILDPIREIFAAEASRAGSDLEASAFSFNVKGGRCEECQGMGEVQIDMHFLPDVTIACRACGGSRYTDEVLAVKIDDLSMSDVLDLTATDATQYFKQLSGGNASVETAHRQIVSRLETMCLVGLGYLQLGQSSADLSGGEAQRLKLINTISRARSSSSHGFLLLDEPSVGLHPADVQPLVDVFDILVGLGTTVVLAEHNLRIASAGDWIVEMGPGAGRLGGKVLFSGTPREFAQSSTGPSASFIRRFTERSESSARAETEVQV